MKDMKDIAVKLGVFAGGVIFGTGGIKILASKDAKKVYTKATAATLRAKDGVMETVTKIRENADDILAEAKDINEERLAEEKLDEEACIICDEGASEESNEM